MSLANNIYQDRERYVVSVVDTFTPEMNVFTCGLNDIVRDYPTKKQIVLTGAQIKMLMGCSMPVPVTEVVDGVSVVRRQEEQPRFAISFYGKYGDKCDTNLGDTPTGKATILTRKEVDAVTNIIENEPKADVGNDLTLMTVDELKKVAAAHKLTVSSKITREALIAQIKRAQREAAELGLARG